MQRAILCAVVLLAAACGPTKEQQAESLRAWIAYRAEAQACTPKNFFACSRCVEKHREFLEVCRHYGLRLAGEDRPCEERPDPSCLEWRVR
jgi:hypothetical protein